MKTTMSDRKFAQLGRLMAAVAVTATLVACGGGGDASPAPASAAPAPAPAPAPGPAPAPAPAPAPNPGDLSTTVKSTTYTAGSDKQVAFQALNAARLQGGFGTVAQNVSLDEEAQNQADFIVANYSVTDGLGGAQLNFAALVALQPDGYETGHIQLSNLPGYTGYTPWDRAQHFGYPSMNVSESAMFGGKGDNYGAQCVGGLLTSPGHRELLLDPRFRDVGVGMATVSLPQLAGLTEYDADCFIATAAESMSYGASGMATAPDGWVAIFPADGSTVSTTDSHGHGFAPSVTVDSKLTLNVTSFKITDASGKTVATTLNVDALNAANFKNWAFATPNTVLQPNTTYTVNFQGSAGGNAIAKTWSFTTGAY
jgi:uncharacterized protein YkwD